MQLSVLDQIIVVVYLAAIMSIGFAMKRKAAKGMSSYFLGGRQLPWWALAMSGSSSYFDITGTMWIVSTFIALGLKGMCIGCGAFRSRRSTLRIWANGFAARTR